MRKHWLFCTILMLCLNTHFVNSQSGTAGQAGEFLRYGVGAKALGMGGAYTAIASDASAIYWNPAGISQLNQIYLGFMQSQLFLDTKYQFLGIAGPVDFLNKGKLKHTFGFGFINLQTDDFDGRDIHNQPTGSFDTREYALLFPYALNIVNTWGDFNFGIKPQFFSQSIQNKSSGGVGLDVGIIYQPLSPSKYTGLGFIPLKYLMPLRIGINYRMLSSVKLVSEKFDYPNSLNLGLSYAVPLNTLPLKVQLSYEHERVLGTKRDAMNHLGGEFRYWLAKSFIASLRLGFNLNSNAFENTFNWGLGFKTDPDWLSQAPFVKGLELDFSQMSHPELDNAFHVYFTVKVGTWKNNVRRFAETEANKQNNQYLKTEQMDSDDLLDFMAEYPFDDRVAGEHVGVDSLYRDVVATELYARAKSDGDVFLTKRYRDFIGRLGDIEWPEPPIYTEANPGCDQKEITRVYTDFIKIFDGKDEELSKDFNLDLLRLYLKAHLILGKNEQVKSIVNGNDGIRNKKLLTDKNETRYFLAYAGKDVAICDSVIKLYKPVNKGRELFLKLTIAVKSGSTDGITKLLADNKDLLFVSNDEVYDHSPFLCDGILADDFMFANAIYEMNNLPATARTAKNVRNLFIPILLELPQSDIGRVISSQLARLNEFKNDYDGTRALFENLWTQYKNLFLSNRIITKDSILEIFITQKQ